MMERIDVLQLIGRDVTLRYHASTNGGEWVGACPFCRTGDDRFIVWPKTGRWWCRICNRSGDAIQYVRERDKIGYLEALNILGIERPLMNKTIPEPARQSAVAEVPILAPPGPLWQERGEKFATTAARSLWEPAGARALGWLQRRCLTDETIRAAQLGYNEADTWESPTLWGLPADHKKIWLPRGIVMPWWIGGQLWRVNVRRSAGDPKYVGPAGWSRSLYNTDALESNRPVVLVEGEIDALTIKQVAEDVAVPVATGSTSGGRDPCWIGLLALAPLVLVAFDCDDGGEKGAAYWLKTLSLARRWRPLWNDVNQMAQEGADIRCWVVDGVFHHDARLGTQLAHEWAGANREPAKIKLEDLADYLETNQLQVVGGDANLHDKSWPPRIRLAERPAALGAKTTDVFSIDGNVTYVARR